MKHKLKATIAALATMGLVAAIFALPALAHQETNQNHEHYYLHNNADAVACYKYEANSSGGSVNSHGQSWGSFVKLNTFQQSWPGDRWETLVIKAGTENRVIDLPSAGVWYQSSNEKKVSHWIVCKGETPSTTTTSSTSSTSTSSTSSTTSTTSTSLVTTTTQPTTTTTEQVTTTTQPESTTTTVPESTTTTDASSSTTSTVGGSTTVPPTSTPTLETLPLTGFWTGLLVVLAIFSGLLGGMILYLVKTQP